jgi:hypothetical protein
VTLLELFDALLLDRKLTLRIETKQRAESLRVSLVRKFSNYKTQMDAIGFLDPSLEVCGCSLQWDKESKLATIALRPRTVVSIQYELIDQAKTDDAS